VAKAIRRARRTPADIASTKRNTVDVTRQCALAEQDAIKRWVRVRPIGPREISRETRDLIRGDRHAFLRGQHALAGELTLWPRSPRESRTQVVRRFRLRR